MRLEGTIKSWDDERGFGFISPSEGGQDIFVHFKAFQSRGQRPKLGQAITFEIEVNPQGKMRAKAVELLRAEPNRPRHQTGSARWATAPYFAIPAFMGLYLLAAIVWKVPDWVAAVYQGASVLAFLIYAADKSAAKAGSWRVSESTLLFVGLAGGWPGAIVAQQLLRHKSSKASFRFAFWGTVALNVAAFVALSSPIAKRFVQNSVL